MGFMDKFKNLFTDEEIIEEDINEPIEIKEIKKEETHKLPTFMRERLDTEENSSFKNEISFNTEDEDFEKKYNINKESKSEFISLDNESKKIEEKKSFKFPLEFNDEDFIETRSRHNRMQTKNMEEQIQKKEPIKPTREIKEQHVKSVKKDSTKVADIYKEKKQEIKKFKATPIISPIYGVLNKNYNSDEVACVKGKNLEETRHSKSVDFDSVRKKAYGNISREIKENLMCENCEYLKEAKECKKQKEKAVEDNIVYEALNEGNNIEDEYDYYSNITLDEATENYYDHGVEYEKKPIKSRTRRDQDILINNHEDDTEQFYKKKSIPPVKSSINLLSTIKKSMGEDEEEQKNLELTDDLFNLIDSMYDERND